MKKKMTQKEKKLFYKLMAKYKKAKKQENLQRIKLELTNNI